MGIKIDNSTVMKVVKQCNGVIKKYGLNLLVMESSTKKDLLMLEGCDKSYYIYIFKLDGRVVIADKNYRNLAWFEFDSTMEIVQFITIVMATYMRMEVFSVRILQSPSSWNKHKLIMLDRNNLCTINTEVLRVAMLYSFITVENAKLHDSGNIIVDMESLPSVKVDMRIDYDWKQMNEYITSLEAEGYFNK